MRGASSGRSGKPGASRRSSASPPRWTPGASPPASRTASSLPRSPRPRRPSPSPSKSASATRRRETDMDKDKKAETAGGIAIEPLVDAGKACQPEVDIVEDHGSLVLYVD